MKEYSLLLICMLICITLFGCKGNNTENTTVKFSKPASASTAVEITEEVKTTLTTTTEKITKEKITKNESSKEKNTTVKKEKTSAEKTSVKQSTAKCTEKKISQTTVKTDTLDTTVPITTQQTTTDSTPEIFNCYFSIECTKILSNFDNLKSGHAEYLPDNAVFLDNYCCEVKNGETVFDALEQVCKENNIKLTTKSDMYGKYIIGFNNIDEKDCGANSGWTYTVNGAYPPKSCDKYKLSQNDTVVFLYTCS